MKAPTCSLGRLKTPAGMNFSWLRRPKRPRPSSQAAIGFRLPRASRYGAGRRSVVTRAAAYSSRIGVMPKRRLAAEPTASRFASSMLA